VACDIDATLGNYSIQFLLEVDSWEYSYFAPIRRSQFTLYDKKDETIAIADIGIIPQGGESFPLKITLSHPVENYMLITIGRIGNVPTGATVDLD